MIDNPSDVMEIQIDDKKPFIPDVVYKAGNEFGTDETTKDTDGVRVYKPNSMYAVVHYEINGKVYKGFYRYGKWANGTNGMPRFVVRELLSIK